MRTKVCFFVGSMTLGGIGKLTLHLMEEFLKRNIAVDLFLMKGGGEYIEQVPKNVRVFIEEGSYFRRIRKFITYLNKEKPVISISARQRQDLVNILSCLLSFGKTRPIITIHTNVSVENLIHNKFRTRGIHVVTLSKLLYKIPKKFIAVSKGVADDFAHRTGVKRTLIKVIHNPVYRSNIEISKPEKAPQTYEKLMSEGRKYIIAVGRLTQQKDFSTLIKAFNIVRKRENVALVVLGEGPLRGTLENEIAELRLEKDVFLLGFVNNPYYYIKKAEAFVLSSRWEGFGIVIVEAMVVGTPIISTNCPSGPDEILENGKYGRLVPVENPEEMAEAIIDTLNTPHDPELLIEKAKDFSIEKIAQEYLQYIFYNKVVDE